MWNNKAKRKKQNTKKEKENNKTVDIK